MLTIFVSIANLYQDASPPYAFIAGGVQRGMMRFNGREMLSLREKLKSRVRDFRGNAHTLAALARTEQK